MCVSAACKPELDALWDVTIHQGVIAPTDDGEAWDPFNGLPDPYVVVSVGGMTGQSSVFEDELFPSWDELLLSNVTTLQLQDNLEIEVFDSDFGFDQLICGGVVESPNFGETTIVGCSNNGEQAWSLAFSITPAAE